MYDWTAPQPVHSFQSVRRSRCAMSAPCAAPPPFASMPTASWSFSAPTKMCSKSKSRSEVAKPMSASFRRGGAIQSERNRASFGDRTACLEAEDSPQYQFADAFSSSAPVAEINTHLDVSLLQEFDGHFTPCAALIKVTAFSVCTCVFFLFLMHS